MCRSKSEGGRRCPGATTRSTTRTGTARTGTPASRTDQTGTAAPMRPVLVVEDETRKYVPPSRTRTDELAAAYPANATGWDGQPLSDTDRRLYALRDAGWTGPIDQDGYPDTTSESAGILRRMA